MEIIINSATNEECLKNIAFIRALLIKYSIENLKIDYSQKEQLRKQILEYPKSS